MVLCNDNVDYNLAVAHSKQLFLPLPFPLPQVMVSKSVLLTQIQQRQGREPPQHLRDKSTVKLLLLTLASE